MWTVRSSSLASIAVMVLAWVGLSSSAGAAEKYTPGEDVEVFFLNSWLPAKVRDSNKKGEVLAEFTFVRQKTEVFPPEKVRHLYESQAIARGRLWSDATGKFKVKAALLKISGGKVELRTEDMKDVAISIEKLSPKDQTFVKQFQQQAGLAALPIPELPTITEFDTRSASSSKGLDLKFRFFEDAKTESTTLQLNADPIRKGLELTQAGAGFPTESRVERLSSLIALGGADNWMLASIGEDDRQPTRLMWVSLAKGSVKKIQILPAGEMLMDYHAGSRQMLTYSKRQISGSDRDEHPVLTVWQTDPSTEEPKAVASWKARLPGDTSWHMSVPWVRFATATHIVQRTETHRIMAWDLSAKRLAWTTPQESFFAPEPQLSAGGKYVYVPEDSGLRIIESVSGKTVGQVPMNGCSGVGVHADGRRIAVANRTDIFVVDITGGEPTRKLSANSVGSPFGLKFDWVTDSLLCFDNGSSGYVLYSLEHALPIWTYTFDHEAYWAYSGNGGRRRSIVDDHLVYAATFNIQGKSGLAVGAVKMPGEKAEAAIASVKRADFMAIKAGAHFRVEVTALDHANEIRQAIEKEVVANGWILDPSAPNVLQAEYKRGETRSVQYDLQSVRDGGRQTQSASITPYVSTLTLKIGQDLAWQTGTASGPPPMVTMRDAGSLQSEVDRWNSPTWSYFQSVDIPAEIVDPKMSGGVGKTAVTNRGLLEQPLGEISTNAQ